MRHDGSQEDRAAFLVTIGWQDTGEHEVRSKRGGPFWLALMELVRVSGVTLGLGSMWHHGIWCIALAGRNI